MLPWLSAALGVAVAGPADDIVCTIVGDGLGATAEILDEPGGRRVARVGGAVAPDRQSLAVTTRGVWWVGEWPGLRVEGHGPARNVYPKAPLALSHGTVAFPGAGLAVIGAAGDRLVVAPGRAIDGWTPVGRPSAEVGCDQLALRVLDPSTPAAGEPWLLVDAPVQVTSAAGEALGALEPLRRSFAGGPQIAWVGERDGDRARVRVVPSFTPYAIDGWIRVDQLGQALEVGPSDDGDAAVGGDGGSAWRPVPDGCTSDVPLLIVDEQGAAVATVGVLGPGHRAEAGAERGDFVEVTLPSRAIRPEKGLVLAAPSRAFRKACRSP